MTDRFHLGTFLWGVVLTLAGAAIAGDGFGWWDLGVIDLAYLAPTLLILVGVVVVIAALGRGARSEGDRGGAA
ncbi:MAG TPA: hypothetical protein VFO17_01290 [Acidimicrobiia bacterium]|jgi:hypothetical protein|nr:hypothetical protein [Acidimicrobiia bacterium]